MKAYVINLDRNPDRLKAATQRFDELDIAFERFAAVDGKAVSDEDFEKFASTRPRCGVPWKKGKMGCFLSHYYVWQKIAAGTEAYVAVFEDDLHISDDIKPFLQDLSWIPEGCDLIRLESSTNRALLSPPLTLKNGRSICRVGSTTWCTGAYILSKKAAEKLLAVPEKYHNSADHFMMSYEHSPVPSMIFTAQVVPALCIQDKFAHKNSKDIRFHSMIIDNDDEAPTLGVRLRHTLRQSPFRTFVKILKGYKHIRYSDKVA